MFHDFARPVEARFNEMSKGELFVVEAPDLFDRYLAAYPEGTNPMFRKRTEHDCQTCKHFVRRLGVVVSIKNAKMVTVWGDLDVPEPYKTVADALDAYIRTLPIAGVFRTKERQYGNDHNYDDAGQRYEHFVGKVAGKHCCADADTKRGEQAAVYQVCQRGLKEIRDDDIAVVLELIGANQLYRGEEHKPAIVGFQKLLKDYRKAGSSDLFIWENLEHKSARFRNTVIGTLLVDLAEGKDLESAVRSFETKVAPTNYKRTSAVITQKMVEQAIEKLNNLGLGADIYRRYARLSDVSVNDVLFVDNESKSKMKDGVASLLEGSIQKAVPDGKKATCITADAFVQEVLPKAKTVEVLVENRHLGNFVSLTAPDREDASGGGPLFRWNNGFAWSYDGDVADSVKQRVKAAGGNINAKLRVSLSWFNTDDLDLHARTPSGRHVCFMDKQGILDVDMNVINPVRNAVENLAFNYLENGVYKISVHNYRWREAADPGFAIEVECGGVLHQHNYPSGVRHSHSVDCFKLHVKDGALVKVETDLPGGMSSQEKWGVKTETLVPVSAITYSPNYWGDQQVGAKHLIFALKGCKNPDSIRGFYNEFLRSELEPHRKVFEVLGAKAKCKPADDQISGVGFTAARGDTVTVVVDGRRSYCLSF